MKTMAAVFGIGGVLWACSVGAGDYRLDWSTVDSGGGHSTGGVYSVSGAIGQPGAGTLSGGVYTLAGGFWAVVGAVQSPGTPLLSIRMDSSGSLMLSWPLSVESFGLQQNPVLATTNWVSVTNSAAQADGHWQVTLTPPAGNRFYRLTKQ